MKIGNSSANSMAAVAEVFRRKKAFADFASFVLMAASMAAARSRSA
ncbi:hypothetical protein [Neomesorhizobium albiziae]|nr:hypothetical protein [Mesorhizobium albiziae]